MRIFACLFLLSACTHRPEFVHGETGYTAKDTPVAGIILIQLHIPGGMTPEIANEYLARAAGEECATRHFLYFDYAADRKGDGRAFCYSQPRAPHLGFQLDPKALPALRVEDMPRGSPVHPGDIILRLGGRDVHDAAELKETAYIAAKNGAKRISVSVERSQIPFMLDCAMDTSNFQIGTPDSLEDLRTKFK
jgi:hypothetical protein